MEVNLDESYLRFNKSKTQRVLVPGEEAFFWSKRVKEIDLGKVLGKTHTLTPTW